MSITTKYKVGDEVKVVNQDKTCLVGIVDKKAVVEQVNISSEGKTFYKISMKESNGSWWVKSSELEIINAANTTNTMHEKVSLKEKFISFFLSEPTKSLRKAGLINGDNLATSEGVTLYVSYLMTKDEAFNKEVVQGLLKKDKDCDE